MAKINNQPASRLDNFTSYSYYHILVMCGSTAVASSLSSSEFTGHLELWQHPTAFSPPPKQDCVTTPSTSDANLQVDPRYSVKYLDGGGTYIVLVNGSTDAHFSIDSFTSETLVLQTTLPSTTAATLVVSEPMGVAFLDTLVRAREALGVSPKTATFVLKTIFVGYTDTDRVVQQAITDIPPLICTMNDITATITETGSVWTLSLIGSGSGGGSTPDIDMPTTKIDIVPLTPQKQQTIGEAMKELIDQLNKDSTKTYNCYVASQKQANIAAGMSAEEADIQASKSFAKVTYSYNFSRLKDGMTELERKNAEKTDATSYENYLIDNVGDGTQTANGKTTDAVPIRIRAGTSIIKGMHEAMFQKSQAITAESAGFMVKIQPRQIYTQGADCQHNVEIVYEIHRVANPTALATTGGKKGAVIEAQGAKIDNIDQLRTYMNTDCDLVVFDYLFTGKNTDILTMDLAISNGLGLWMSAKAVSPFKPPVRNIHSTSIISPNPGTQRKQLGATAAPVVASRPTPIVMASTNQTASVNYMDNINRNALIESSAISIKIKGMDSLLFSAISTDPHSPPSEEPFAAFATCPMFAQINIAMPQTANYENLIGLDSYAVPFWHLGYYTIVSINHSFVDGEFTQQLSLMAISTQSESEFGDQQSAVSRENKTSSETNPCDVPNSDCASNQIASTPLSQTSIELTPEMHKKLQNYEVGYNIDPKVTVIDEANEYYLVTSMPDPEMAIKNVTFNPPRFMDKKTYDEIVAKQQRLSIAQAASPLPGNVDPVIATKASNYEINRTIENVKKDAQSAGIKMSQHVGNKIPCSDLVAQTNKVSSNTGSGSGGTGGTVVDGKTVVPSPNGGKDIVNTKDSSRTATGIPPVDIVVGGKSLIPGNIFTNYFDSEEVNRAATVDDVPAYIRAPQSTKDAMNRAVADAGCSPSLLPTLLLIASAESNYDISAKNPKSSAGGLFQFTGGTWTEVASKIPGVNPNDPNFLSLKNDAYYATYAAVKFTEGNAKYCTSRLKKNGIDRPKLDPAELYLMHHFGGGGGTDIILAYHKGLGNTLFSDNSVAGHRGQGYVSGVYSANPQLARYNVYTVNDFYFYASALLARKADTSRILARRNGSSSTPTEGQPA